MKKYFLSFAVILAVFVLVSSCSKCITCEIRGNSINEIFIDSAKIFYDEFCGKTDECDAFQADVEYAAVNRKCIVYSIRKIHEDQVLLTMTMCGSIEEQVTAQEKLDSIFQADYANADAKIQIDTTISNPGTWKCK